MSLGLITGLIGGVLNSALSIFSKREDRKAESRRYQHEAERWVHERELVALRADVSVQETEQKLITITTQGSFDGLVASHKSAEALAYRAPLWALGLISAMRPVLTLALFAMTAISAWVAISFVLQSGGINLTADTTLVEAARELHLILENNAALLVIYELTQMAVAWWFGDRSFKRAVEHSRIGGDIRLIRNTNEGGTSLE